jgi:hypothetical protein
MKTVLDPGATISILLQMTGMEQMASGIPRMPID